MSEFLQFCLEAYIMIGVLLFFLNLAGDFDKACSWGLFWPVLIIIKAIKSLIKEIKNV